MNEVEAYHSVYGDLVYQIPHYDRRVHTVTFTIRPDQMTKEHRPYDRLPSGDLVVRKRLELKRN